MRRKERKKGDRRGREEREMLDNEVKMRWEGEREERLDMEVKIVKEKERKDTEEDGIERDMRLRR